MRANILFVKERFDHFNRLCFDGVLPEIPLRISSSSRTWGTLRHPRVRPKHLREEDVVLSISNRLDLEQEVVEDTIIHEMIHLYIYWFDIKDTSAHGQAFRRIMHGINTRHNRHITISRKSTAEERDSDRLQKLRVVIVSTLDSGEKTVTVCSPRYSKRIAEDIRKTRMVQDWRAFISDSPTFGRYPSSRTAKLYKIDPDDLAKALEKAHPLTYKDGKFTYN